MAGRCGRAVRSFGAPLHHAVPPRRAAPANPSTLHRSRCYFRNMFLNSTLEAPEAVPKQKQRGRPGLVLAAAAVVQFMVSLDLSVVNVGLPQIAAGLGFSAVGLTWVIHAYALTFGGLLLLGGEGRRPLRPQAGPAARTRPVRPRLGCRRPRRRPRASSSPPGPRRASAPPRWLRPRWRCSTADLPAGRARIRAFGIWSAMNAAGGALGVLIGGLLTEYAGWRWVMFVNVPIVAVALALALAGRRRRPGPARGEPSGHARRRPGHGGHVAAGVRRRAHRPVRVGFAGHPDDAGGRRRLLAAFVHVERTTAREPLIRLGLLANRSVAGANAYNLLLGAAMASAFYFVSLYLQRVLGHGPALTGISSCRSRSRSSPDPFVAVKLGYRLAPRTLLVGGGLLTATGFAWFGLISADGAFLDRRPGPVDHRQRRLRALPRTGRLHRHRRRRAARGRDRLGPAQQLAPDRRLTRPGRARHRGAAPHRRSATPEALNDGYALGLTLSAALLVAAVLIALAVLRRPAADCSGAARSDSADRIGGVDLVRSGNGEDRVMTDASFSRPDARRKCPADQSRDLRNADVRDPLWWPTSAARRPGTSTGSASSSLFAIPGPGRSGAGPLATVAVPGPAGAARAGPVTPRHRADAELCGGRRRTRRAGGAGPQPRRRPGRRSRDTPWNTRDLTTVDPDGNVVVFTAARPPERQDAAFSEQMHRWNAEQGLDTGSP